ncbi:DUF2231 domain-containing protein [Allopusillimonas ginsengisoli]|uniref:DUF2231 domain-containing protein n=1 Tax=Allopusillimonas ginsengisoli TaxID=453575 RepID=UPI0039C3EBC0
MSRIVHHLLHPALVHFPIACWSLAVVTDFAKVQYPQRIPERAKAPMTQVISGYETAPRCNTSTIKRPQMRKPPFCQIFLLSGRR